MCIVYNFFCSDIYHLPMFKQTNKQTKHLNPHLYTLSYLQPRIVFVSFLNINNHHQHYTHRHTHTHIVPLLNLSFFSKKKDICFFENYLRHLHHCHHCARIAFVMINFNLSFKYIAIYFKSHTHTHKI